MSPGDLVRYKKFPHKELHESGLIGLIISELYVEKKTLDEPWQIDALPSWPAFVDVIWGNDRGTLYPARHICQEYADELEIVEWK